VDPASAGRGCPPQVDSTTKKRNQADSASLFMEVDAVRSNVTRIESQVGELGNLLHQVILDPHMRDLVELRFQPVDVVFLVG
jgi:hypothetical protein